MALTIKLTSIMLEGGYSVTPNTFKRTLVSYQVYDASNPDLVKNATLEDLNVVIDETALGQSLATFFAAVKQECEDQEGI